jgi:hypothetical protein
MQSSSSDQVPGGKPKSFADMMPSVRSMDVFGMMELDGVAIAIYGLLRSQV